MLSSTTLVMLANRGHRQRNRYLDAMTAVQAGVAFTRINVQMDASDLDPETLGTSDAGITTDI